MYLHNADASYPHTNREYADMLICRPDVYPFDVGIFFFYLGYDFMA
jgi:hypothetical protein